MPERRAKPSLVCDLQHKYYPNVVVPKDLTWGWTRQEGLKSMLPSTRTKSGGDRLAVCTSHSLSPLARLIKEQRYVLLNNEREWEQLPVSNELRKREQLSSSRTVNAEGNHSRVPRK